MKSRYRGVWGYAFCAVCDALLSVIWLYLGFFRKHSWFYVVLGAAWLICTGIWAVRAVRTYKKIKTSNENCVINGGNDHE
jgi:hypothetical protein